ncbi:MAG: alpha/beta fold hydrolase [Gemmatimonadales bacterium]|nr:MAG: alpha/beta fold hydrolase [Gemmatimonadales bacterium]
MIRAIRWAVQASSCLGLLLVVAACSEATAPEERRVDLDRLFAPATESEVAAVRAEWAARTSLASGVRQESSGLLSVAGAAGRFQVVSHLVDGHRHYGAIVTPVGAEPRSLPVLVFAHGGDDGVSAAELTLYFLALGDAAASFVWVVPSFRSEPLRWGLETFTSEGEPSPWNRDVDDALSLLSVAFEEEPAADPDRVAVLGLSRGGGVGLLMGARDPRVKAVVSFFGPTDFFDPWMQGIVGDALQGRPRDLPGLDWLDRSYLQPLSRGELSVDAVRREFVRRSAVLFAPSLPAVQIHHGTADPIVAFSQAERLDAVMRSLGRGEPEYEFFAYPGGGHIPLTLPGSIGRTATFLLAQ